MLSFLAPGLVYRLNFSVGRYRIKPKAIDDLVDWCVEQGYLQLHSEHDDQSRAFISYFSHQPTINDWQISVYLEWLRRDHPALSKMDWATIAAGDQAIAKLYSGYMGAGGAWETWRDSNTPGAEARKRLRYDEVSGGYRLIDKLRKQVP
jgi:hypothetical protein